MAQVWTNTSVFIKEEEINWNINDFALLWNVSGGSHIYSPHFQIGNKKYQLLIYEHMFLSLTVDGVLVEPADNLLVGVSFIKPKDICLVGASLNMDLDGQKIVGIFGDPNGKTIETTAYYFTNQSSKVIVDGNFCEAFFCISRHTTHMGIKIKLYVPGPITNTVSQEHVKDAGPAKLLADVRAMLNRSTENADFSVECGGKIFPCHEFILRARSTVLDTMFQNEMAEKSMRSMTVVDVGPNTMEVFLAYLYTGEIPAKVENMKELIYMADKYDLKGLMEICFRKLPDVEDHMVVDFLFMADKHNFIEFKKEAMRRINMNKSKYMEDKKFVEKLQEVPRLLLELYKL